MIMRMVVMIMVMVMVLLMSRRRRRRGVRRDLVLHLEPYVAALALLQEHPRVLEDGRLRNLCSNGWRWC